MGAVAQSQSGIVLGRAAALGPGRLGLRTKSMLADAAGIDGSRMLVPGTITNDAEDRSGDIVLTAGGDFSEHEALPVVLVDHGLEAGLTLPIGQAEIDGRYTVQKGNGLTRAVTRFSQRSRVAHQVFRLYEEGILRGLSIGFIPEEAEDLPSGGTLHKRWRLYEYSHVTIPDNPHALADRIGAGRIGAESVEGMLLKSLSRHLPPLKQAVRGGFDAASAACGNDAVNGGSAQGGTGMAEQKKADEGTKAPAKADAKGGAVKKGFGGMNETVGADGGYVPLDDGKEKDKPEGDQDDVPDAEEKAMLPGAKALAGAHGLLGELGAHVEASYGSQENPAVTELLDELSDAIAGLHSRIEEAHAKNYPDSGPLGGEKVEKDLDGEKGEGGAEDDVDGDGEESEEEVLKRARTRLTKSGARLAERLRKAERAKEKAIADKAVRSVTKRLGKSAAAACTKAADLLDEMASHEGEMKSSHRAACTHHAGVLRSLAAQPDEAGAEELKSLKADKARLEAELAEAKAAVGRVEKNHKALLREFNRAKGGR